MSVFSPPNPEALPSAEPRSPHAPDRPSGPGVAGPRTQLPHPDNPNPRHGRGLSRPPTTPPQIGIVIVFLPGGWPAQDLPWRVEVVSGVWGSARGQVRVSNKVRSIAHLLWGGVVDRRIKSADDVGWDGDLVQFSRNAASHFCQSGREPAKTLRSTWPLMPGTEPFAVYCQNSQLSRSS